MIILNAYTNTILDMLIVVAFVWAIYHMLLVFKIVDCIVDPIQASAKKVFKVRHLVILVTFVVMTIPMVVMLIAYINQCGFFPIVF